MPHTVSVSARITTASHARRHLVTHILRSTLSTFHTLIFYARSHSTRPFHTLIPRSSHADYPRGLSNKVPKGTVIPQHWIDDYVNQTAALFRFFAPASMPSRVCVLWRPMQITAQHNGTGPHHPSIVGGFHDWINLISGALARQHGIGVLETTPLLKGIQARGFRQADADGHGGSEGDPYHGVPASAFVPRMLQQACTACERRLRASRQSRGRLIPTGHRVYLR